MLLLLLSLALMLLPLIAGVNFEEVVDVVVETPNFAAEVVLILAGPKCLPHHRD